MEVYTHPQFRVLPTTVQQLVYKQQSMVVQACTLYRDIICPAICMLFLLLFTLLIPAIVNSLWFTSSNEWVIYRQCVKNETPWSRWGDNILSMKKWVIGVMLTPQIGAQAHWRMHTDRYCSIRHWQMTYHRPVTWALWQLCHTYKSIFCATRFTQWYSMVVYIQKRNFLKYKLNGTPTPAGREESFRYKFSMTINSWHAYSHHHGSNIGRLLGMTHLSLLCNQLLAKWLKNSIVIEKRKLPETFVGPTFINGIVRARQRKRWNRKHPSS